jgi:hypothetical protein
MSFQSPYGTIRKFYRTENNFNNNEIPNPLYYESIKENNIDDLLKEVNHSLDLLNDNNQKINQNENNLPIIDVQENIDFTEDVNQIINNIQNINDKDFIENELKYVNNKKMLIISKNELENPIRLNQSFQVYSSIKDNTLKNHLNHLNHSFHSVNRSNEFDTIKKDPIKELSISLLKCDLHSELLELIKLKKKMELQFKELDKQRDEILQIIENSPYNNYSH